VDEYDIDTGLRLLGECLVTLAGGGVAERV